MANAVLAVAKADFGPIRSTLQAWWSVNPDLYATAWEGIRRISAGVREWFALERKTDRGWHARVHYYGVVIEFIYGCCDGAERLIFTNVALGAVQPLARMFEPERFRAVIAAFLMAGTYIIFLEMVAATFDAGVSSGMERPP